MLITENLDICHSMVLMTSALKLIPNDYDFLLHLAVYVATYVQASQSNLVNLFDSYILCGKISIYGS